MRIFDEIQEELGFTDAQMSRFLEVSRSAYSALKSAQGNQHMRFIRQLEKIRIHMGKKHKEFYGYIEKVAKEELDS